MSIKRYQNGVPIKKGTKFPAKLYHDTLHEKCEIRHYSLECGKDVHCITVMPNKTVHFHNHKSMNEMVHLVTFDIMQNPEIEKSTLPTCLRILRGLRTGKPFGKEKYFYNRTTVEHYTAELIENNLSPKKGRQAFNPLNPELPWRQEMLNTFKKDINEALTKELSYYGMKENIHAFQMNFNFNLTQSFMPHASMSLDKKEQGYGKVLTLDIQVSPKWLIGVWKKGRAIVNKSLILNVIREYPNGTCLAMVAKQSHGFKVIPRLAVVDFNRQAISWIIDKEKKEEVLNEERTPRMRRTKKEIEATKRGEVIPGVENDKPEEEIPF